MSEVPSRTDFTKILNSAGRGDASALDSLLPLVYDELRSIAENCLQSERSGHTLQATALVHEAYVRLIKQDEIEWTGRAHFFAIASKTIRRILVDYARARRTAKRGGVWKCVQLAECELAENEPALDMIALDAALDKLKRLHPRQAQVVELRFFGGLTLRQAAECLDVSPRTVDSDWQVARAWLRRELSGGEVAPPP